MRERLFHSFARGGLGPKIGSERSGALDRTRSLQLRHSASSRLRGYLHRRGATSGTAHPQRNSLLTYLSSALTKGLRRGGSRDSRGCKRLRRGPGDARGRAETEAYFRPSFQARLSRVSRAVPRRSIHNESEIVPEREFLKAARYSGRHRERERERERESALINI